MKTPVLPNMMPKLQKLFEDELRNIFSAEIALLNTMIILSLMPKQLPVILLQKMNCMEAQALARIHIIYMVTIIQFIPTIHKIQSANVSVI